MPEPKLVAISAKINTEHRAGLKVAAAQHDLSMSAAIGALAHAAADGDDRLHAVLADYAECHRRQHGGAR